MNRDRGLSTEERVIHTTPPSPQAPEQRGRSLILVAAAALLLIPAAIGWFMLRNPAAQVRGAPISSEQQSDIERSADGSDIASSADALTPRRTVEETRIKYLSDEGEVAIANGGVVPLTDELQVEVFMAPYPPTNYDLDVDFYLTSPSGTPVTDAEITVIWDMSIMRHGPFETEVDNIGGGHYVASFDFFMFGPWELNTELTVPGTDGFIEQPISIFVWPS